MDRVILHRQRCLLALLQAHLPHSLHVGCGTAVHKHSIRASHRNRVCDLEQCFLIGDLAQFGQVRSIALGLKHCFRFIESVDPSNPSQDVNTFLQFKHVLSPLLNGSIGKCILYNKLCIITLQPYPSYEPLLRNGQRKPLGIHKGTGRIYLIHSNSHSNRR